MWHASLPAAEDGSSRKLLDDRAPRRRVEARVGMPQLFGTMERHRRAGGFQRCLEKGALAAIDNAVGCAMHQKKRRLGAVDPADRIRGGGLLDRFEDRRADELRLRRARRARAHETRPGRLRLQEVGGRVERHHAVGRGRHVAVGAVFLLSLVAGRPQHARQMAAGRYAEGKHALVIQAESLGMAPQPAHGRANVMQLRRPDRLAGQAVVNGGEGEAPGDLGERHRLDDRPVARRPCATVQVHDRGKRGGAALRQIEVELQVARSAPGVDPRGRTQAGASQVPFAGDQVCRQRQEIAQQVEHGKAHRLLSGEACRSPGRSGKDAPPTPSPLLTPLRRPVQAFRRMRRAPRRCSPVADGAGFSAQTR